jgi:DNA-binding GntR family transcriptional regulator
MIEEVKARMLRIYPNMTEEQYAVVEAEYDRMRDTFEQLQEREQVEMDAANDHFHYPALELVIDQIITDMRENISLAVIMRLGPLGLIADREMRYTFELAMRLCYDMGTMHWAFHRYTCRDMHEANGEGND